MEQTQLMPGLIRFQDDTQSTFYLVIGEKKALAIDCGTGHAPVMPFLCAYTDLPIELAVTHAHGDHYGAAHEFSVVYMHEADAAILPEMQARFGATMGVKPVGPGTLVSVAENDGIDLGGTRIRVLALGGHTPGSCVFVDPTHQVIFTGDAIGSGMGVWMQVIRGLPLSEYAQSLAHFIAAAKPYETYRFLGGHYTQEGEPGSEAYNPLDMALAWDMERLCRGLLRGEIPLEDTPMPSFCDEPAKFARLGKAGMVVLESRIG